MGHFYTRTGEPQFYVPRAGGIGTRDSHVGDARKNGWLPSVTEILKEISKPQIEKYKVRQGILAALTLPRIEGENNDEYVDRIYKDAEEHSKAARDRGTEIHSVIERYIKGEQVEPEHSQLIYHFEEFKAQYGISVICSELRVVGHGYAGTADIVFKAKAPGIKGLVLVDFKGQEVGPRGPQFYEDYLWQIAAYVTAYNDAGTEKEISNGAVIVIDRNTGKFYPQFYSMREINNAYRAFDAAKTIWSIRRDYFPA